MRRPDHKQRAALEALDRGELPDDLKLFELETLWAEGWVILDGPRWWVLTDLGRSALALGAAAGEEGGTG
jgi:hypothetical protein